MKARLLCRACLGVFTTNLSACLDWHLGERCECPPAGTIAQAVRPAIHDVTDGSVMRSWLNSPLSSGLESDIYKATNILNSFAQVGYLQPEKGIPAAVLQGAAGFAILSVAKVIAA